MTTATEKRCGRCLEPKPVDAFYRDRRRDGGRQAYCKSCQDELKAAWRAANPDYWREANLVLRYGLTVEQYDEMFRRQGGVCAICERPPNEAADGKAVRRLNVDHDHDTGIVRGLLCWRCNLLVGHIDADRELLDKAREYLNERTHDVE